MTGIAPVSWEKITAWIETLLGRPLPAAINVALAILVFAALVMSIGLVIALAAAKIREVWETRLRPAAYSPLQKQAALARRRFAKYLLEEISRRNLQENWRDQEYAELEAEVEAEGSRRRLLPLVPRSRGLRREKSLAAALHRSRERLVLVEGEPGSGKSVALRHVAIELAERALKSRSLETRLPVYVNLKELKKSVEEPVDHLLIRKQALRALGRLSNNFTDAFIEANFDEGLSRGTWVFLFDSFDEIPDVLSAVEAGYSVQAYSEALADFMSGMNMCRGVIASRHYRGPKNQGWSTFRVLPLSISRQRELMRKSLVMRPDLVGAIENQLLVAGEDIRNLAQNPMLLGLLCEYMLKGSPFPKNSYEVMAQYLDGRLTRDDGDAARIAKRYKMDIPAMVEAAEAAAFTMTADASLGLSPRAEELVRGMGRLCGIDSGRARNALAALVYMRLARSDAEDPKEEREFTFAHRRFQEYYATRVLLSGERSIPSRDLLTDARWREAAVVLLQHEDAGTVRPLLAEAEELIREAAARAGIGEPSDDETETVGEWTWPSGVHHVLSIIDAGTSHNAALVSDELRRLVGLFVAAACRRGDLLDAKLALQVSGPAPEDVLDAAMRLALNAQSPWLEDAVYWQAARLSELKPSFAAAIRASLFRRGLDNSLKRSIDETRAYLARLPQPRVFLQSLRLAYWAPIIDVSLFVAIAFISTGRSTFDALVIAVSIGLVLIGKLIRERSFSLPRSASRWRTSAAMLLLLLVTASSGEQVSASMDAVAGFFGFLGEKAARFLAGPIGFMIAVPSLTLLLLWWLAWLPSVEKNVHRGRGLVLPLWPLAPLAAMSERFRPVNWRASMKSVAGLVGFILFLGAIGATSVVIISAFPWVSIVFLVPIGLTGLVSAIARTASEVRWLRDRALLRGARPADYADPEGFRSLFGKLRTRRAAVDLLNRLLRTGLSGDPAAWQSTVREILRSDPALEAMSRLTRQAPRPLTAPPSGHKPSLRARLVKLLSEDEDAESAPLYAERDLLFLIMERASIGAAV